jgi:hypothetical protein
MQPLVAPVQSALPTATSPLPTPSNVLMMCVSMSTAMLSPLPAVFTHCAGLYGNVAPVTVQNLVATVQSGAFNGSAFSKISPGEFLQLGKQGSRRMGDVEPPPGKEGSSACYFV